MRLFLLTSLVVVMVPGTGALYTVSTALSRGRRAGLHASLGCALGILPHLALTLLGLAAAFHVTAAAFDALRFVGALYLLHLAVVTWRDRTAFHLDAGAESAAAGAGGHVLRAVLLNILNPKLTIFFLAYLPQFADPAGSHPLWQLLSLGVVFMALTLGVFAIYGLAAHGFRRHVVESIRLQRCLRGAFAAGFAALGVRLALGGH